jgi:hypothetical protein
VLASIVISAICYFLPPADWEFADPSYLAPRVKIGFLGKNQNHFRPSLNLAIEEEVDLDLEGYLKSIKEVHEQGKGKHWRDLGSFTTAAGKARLTSLDTHMEGGKEARLLQLIFLKNRTAYILTASTAKEDLPKFRKEIETAFRSLTLTDNLLENLNLEKQQKWEHEQHAFLLKCIEERKKFASLDALLADESFQKKTWGPFQQKVIEEIPEWGPYGQLLFLYEIQKKLFDREHS